MSTFRTAKVRRRSALLTPLFLVMFFTACTSKPMSEKPPPQQPSTAPSQFSDYNVRKREVDAIRADLAADFTRGLARARTYAAHPSEDLRRDVYATLWDVGKKSEDAAQRQRIVEALLDGVRREDGWIKDQLFKWLQDFSAPDYSEVSRAILSSLPLAPGESAALIRILGIVGMKSATPALEEIAREPPDPSVVGFQARDPWAAHLALARMGDVRYARRVVAAVAGEKDNIVRATLLFADLGYTRAPAALDALAGYLDSEERLPQIKSNVPGQAVALYAAESLLAAVRNPPLSKPDLRESDLPAIRAWARSQKTWEIRP